jgi:hypothetical protein
LAENEALKRQLKDVQEQRVTDLKDGEERVDRRVREAVREAEERAERLLNTILGSFVFDISRCCSWHPVSS